MDLTGLKEYAKQARRDFIAAVTDRAHQYGLSRHGIQQPTRRGDVMLIGPRAFPASEEPALQSLADRIGRQGFTRVMDEIAYTWFNRFIALRFMELHAYLDHGVRVLSHPAGHREPEILQRFNEIGLPESTLARAFELKLSGGQDEALYRLLLLAQCNALALAMPTLFDRVDGETELLLPTNLLHSDSTLRRLVGNVAEDAWQNIEIIGWLYQFYISERKDEVMGGVVATEDIPAATQLFTPDWIAKYLVQNSLGALWTSAPADSMPYYVPPAPTKTPPPYTSYTYP